MTKIILSIALCFPFLFLSCKRRLHRTLVDTLVVYDSVTRNYELSRVHDTIYIRNNTIIHTQDSGCRSSVKIISEKVKEYLPAERDDEGVVDTSSEMPGYLKRIMWIFGGILILLGMVIVVYIVVSVITRR